METIGFDKTKSFFNKAITDGTISHAYLFSGPEMIGKRTFALELANQDSHTPNPDLIYIDPDNSETGKTISISQIRKIKNFLSLSPFVNKYKFVIINDAHLMTEEGQNALLKILEEPSQSSVLILVTASPDLLLPTITSRCQRINFFPHSKEVIVGIMNDSKISASHKELLIELAAGRIGLVRNILEENSFDEIKNSIEELAQLVKADLEDRFTFAQKMSDDNNRSLLQKKILYWILYARTRLNEPKIPKILKNLLILNRTINQPQYNQRLALENFFLNF